MICISRFILIFRDRKGRFTFQRIVRLYRDSNLRRDEMKDDRPFRLTLILFALYLHIECQLNTIICVSREFYENKL